MTAVCGLNCLYPNSGWSDVIVYVWKNHRETYDRSPGSSCG